MPVTSYETVAASQAGQVIGTSGGVGDEIEGVLVVPTTTSPGAITLIDGSTSVVIFAGGASSLSNLVPFGIPLGLRSVSGAWSITTGAGLSVVATGRFS
jgi:hypothetical protein